MVRFCWLLLVASAVALTAQGTSPGGPDVERLPPIAGARLVETLELRSTLHHVQGVDLDGEHIWVTSVKKDAHRGYLHQFSRGSGRLERVVDVTDGVRFHPGGISVVDGSIWVPVAEYRPDSTALLKEYDKRTLKLKRTIRVADHLGCVAVGRGVIVAGNWGSRKLYVFDRSGRQIRVTDNSLADQYQDMKFADGMLVGSGNLTKSTGAIEWLEWPSLRVVRSAQSGMTDRRRLYTQEGMAIHGVDVYLLPEDGPSRLFHFRLDNK